jgi:hypothetical protein
MARIQYLGYWSSMQMDARRHHQQEEIPQDELRQWAVNLDPQRMAKVFRKQFLVLDGVQIRKLLLPAIEETLERKPDHQIEHWGNRGWWYHGSLTEEEWILLKLKFFV